MQACRYCGGDYPEDRFDVVKVVKGKTYRRRKCRSCQLKSQQARQVKLTEWFVTHKKTLCCSRCSISDYRVLTFHHLDPTQKEGNVSDMAKRGWSIQRVQVEMDKCIILCANCHLIEHHNDVLGV